MSLPTSDAAAIRQVIRALTGSEHKLVSVHNGEERIRTRTEADALTAITDVDEAYLHVNLPDGSTGWVRFVLGNDPEEVAADYTTNLLAVDALVDSWL